VLIGAGVALVGIDALNIDDVRDNPARLTTVCWLRASRSSST
jgi:hypothetical protein